MQTLRSFVLCVLLSIAALPAAALDLAGNVERLQGAATATGGNGFSRPLQVGSTILVGDRIVTGVNARLQLRMNDGAILTLGRNSQLTIEVYDENAAAGRAVLNFVEGVFLAASGAIARLGPENFTINTPVATLGVRGTTVWGEQLADRLAVAMLEGNGVVVSTPQGTVEMTAPESGVDVVAGEAPPAPKQWGAERLQAARAAVSFE